MTVVSDVQGRRGCVDSPGSSSHISPFITVSKTASIADWVWKEQLAASLAAYVGWSDCSPIFHASSNSTLANIPIVVSGDPTSQAPLSTASSSKPVLPLGVKAALGGGIPLATLIILALGLWILQCGKRKHKSTAIGRSPLPESNSLYLQRKGGLEAEESKKYDLHAEEYHHELADNNGVMEMPILSGQKPAGRSESVGEELCKELIGNATDPVGATSCNAGNCLHPFFPTPSPSAYSSDAAFCATFTKSRNTMMSGYPKAASAACGTIASRHEQIKHHAIKHGIQQNII
ncbi:MAG: hypothetical protein Q9170_002393 [Blastenia crenularia]